MPLLRDDIAAHTLHDAKELFLETQGHRSDWLNRVQEDHDFYAGRQWDDKVRRMLERDNRPALTFNLVHQVVRELVGANEDTRRRMSAVPVGFEDISASDAMDHIWQRVYNEQMVPDTERETFEKAVIGGLSCVAIDADPMPGRPDWVRVTLDSLSPFEVYFDPNAEKLDYSDAEYVFWVRWMVESDFKQEYPDFADDWEKLRDQSQGHTFSTTIGPNSGDPLVRKFLISPADLKERDWFRLDEHLILVVHMQYRQAVDRYFAKDTRQDPQSGQTVGWSEIERTTYNLLRKTDVLETRRELEEEVRWLEFTGAQILFDDVQPIPINTFTIIPLLGFMDHRTHEPFGVVDPLKDPQREVNKRYSYELDLTLRQAQPGMDIEEDATDDIDEVKRQRRVVGGTAVFKSGALSGNKVVERVPPQLPAAAADLGERALQNFHRVAGFNLDPLITGRATEEPVGTALMRHRKSLQAITPLLQNFRRFQRKVLEAFIKIVVTLFPDDQIEAMLGDKERWRVQQGVLTDLERQTQIPLRDMRSYRWQVEQEAHADDTTGQVLLLQTSIGAMQAGMPMDPEILADLMPISRDKKVKLKGFIKKTLEQQEAQAAEDKQLRTAEASTTAQRTADIVAIEGSKVEQREKASVRKTELDRAQITLDFAAKVAGFMLADKEGRSERELTLLKMLSDLAQSELPAEEPAAEPAQPAPALAPGV